MASWTIRPAEASDARVLAPIARHLDTVNLPHDERLLTELLALSTRSFAGELPREERVFLFVLADDEGRPFGTSMIFAQHGTRTSPHVYFDVLDEERYSASLDRHVQHRVLRLGFTYDGPTEIGGLVLVPELRSAPERLGRALSLARFLFLAEFPSEARDEVLAELMPPLEADGTSRLWACLGQRFTGLSYREADRLSQKNKEFIFSLFPRGTIYTSLLPQDAQALIGAVGPATKPVERMLTQNGFRYGYRIDPFDGGPHFVARTTAIGAVQSARALRVAPQALPEADLEASPRALVARVEGGARRFRVTTAQVAVTDDEVWMSDVARRVLGVGAGERVRVLS